MVGSPGLLRHGIVILRHEARSFIDEQTCELFWSCDWKGKPPSTQPTLPPSDIHLFQPLMKDLTRKRFATDAEV